MALDFSKHFHAVSKVLARVPVDPTAWPSAWRTAEYKGYGRLPSLALPAPKEDMPIATALRTRRSAIDFTGGSISLTELSTLLAHACGEVPRETEKKARRVQPSGGALYPLEAYAVVLREGPGILSGLYHYDIERHALDVLWRRPFLPADIAALFVPGWATNVTVAIVLTAVFGRTQMKYEERGYRYALIEAGHIGQNIYLIAGALRLKCRALGATHDEALEALIDVDGVTESVVYTLMLGR